MDYMRMIAEPIAFADLVDTLFNSIHQYRRSSAAVTSRLLKAITGVAARTYRSQDLADIYSQYLWPSLR